MAVPAGPFGHRTGTRGRNPRSHGPRALARRADPAPPVESHRTRGSREAARVARQTGATVDRCEQGQGHRIEARVALREPDRLDLHAARKAGTRTSSPPPIPNARRLTRSLSARMPEGSRPASHRRSDGPAASLRWRRKRADLPDSSGFTRDPMPARIAPGRARAALPDGRPTRRARAGSAPSSSSSRSRCPD